jgi:DNA ligase-1
VLTVHGYAKEFAAELRAKGIDAWSAMGGDQLDLPLGKAHVAHAAATNLRHMRPICQLADFSDACRLIGETSSRISKVAYLANYLRGLSDPDDVRDAVRWFAIETHPDPHRVTKNSAQATVIKRSLEFIPGIKPERARETFISQNELSRAVKVILQEVQISLKQHKISEIGVFLRDYYLMEGTLGQIELLSKQLYEMHPVEAETVVRLLTGGMKIGLREEEICLAIREAYQADDGELMAARHLTGDLGEAAVMAKEGRLGERA